MNFSLYVFKCLKCMFHLIIITLRFFSADYLFETTEEVYFKIRTLSLFFFSQDCQQIYLQHLNVEKSEFLFEQKQNDVSLKVSLFFSSIVSTQHLLH